MKTEWMPRLRRCCARGSTSTPYGLLSTLRKHEQRKPTSTKLQHLGNGTQYWNVSTKIVRPMLSFEQKSSL